jgi:hypothetical protein
VHGPPVRCPRPTRACYSCYSCVLRRADGI